MRLYTIGKSVSTHGLKGEVKVYPETSFPERFLEMERVLLGDESYQDVYVIESARIQKNAVILGFRGISDSQAAEALIGKTLFITEDELYELPEDHFYVFDLIGLLVIDEKFGELGTIKDVVQGAQDLYVITPSAGSPASEEFYIPAVKALVKEVDLENRKMLVDLPEGLWD